MHIQGHGLTGSLRRWLRGRPEIRQGLGNLNWLLLHKVFEIVLGLFVGVFVARLLGPERYGIVKYLLAVIAIPTAMAALGLNAIMIRELVHDPSAEPELLGSALLARTVAAALLMGLCVLVLPWLRSDAGTLRPMLALLAIGQTLSTPGLLKAWFDARVESRYVVWVRGGTTAVFAGLKIAVLVFDLALVTFVLVLALEMVVAAMGLLPIYMRRSDYGVRGWRVTWSRTRQLLADGLPMMANGLMAMIYLRADQIMLGQMRTDAEVGIYSVSVVIMQVGYAFPQFALGSFFPALLRARAKDEALYRERLQLAYDGLLWLALAGSLGVGGTAQWLVPFAFGESYDHSASVLAWHVWSLPFHFTGSIAHRHMLAINTTRRLLSVTTMGALVNVVVNFMLIPPLGARGAALATVVALSVSHCLALAFFADTRFLIGNFLRAWIFWKAGLRWVRFLKS